MLELKHISKSFPGVRALDDVSLSFDTGEVHALLGENGAGKSTLLKIICGILKQDEGSIYSNGKLVKFSGYQDAIKEKISIVHQEIQVVPMATIAENIMLDKLQLFSRHGILRWKELNAEAKKYMDMVKLNLDPQMLTGGLSAAQKQLIQIAKSLASGARLILLDEPTSSLTKTEVDNLFVLLRQLKADGVAIVVVTHKIDEVMMISDKISVLRDGRLIGTVPCKGISQEEIIEMMIGRKVKSSWLGSLAVEPENVLEVRDLSSSMFEHAGFSLKKGEILGFYGMVGSGRTELCKTIIGEYPKESGEILVNGKPAKIKSFFDALNTYGIGYVSENRKEEGLILSYDIHENANITSYEKLAHGIFGVMSKEKEKENVQKLIRDLEVKTPSAAQIVNNLSGGNQQKISIGKWLVADCDILIIDEPTIGVDVGAKEYIHNLIWGLAKSGKSIILISSDITELVHLSRRILVFKEYSIVGEIDDLNDPDNVRENEDVYLQIGKLLQG